MSPDLPQLVPVENANAVAFLILSNARFFDEIVSGYRPDTESSNFVDQTVDVILDRIKRDFHPDTRLRVWNTDRAPFFHVQTLGHVAGATEYVPPSSLVPRKEGDVIGNRDPCIWGSAASSVLGVSIHPKYGGWFAFRILIVMEGVTWPTGVEKSTPLNFLSAKDKDIIVYEYNKNPDLARWRDFNNGQYILEKYDTAQYLYFHENSTAKRRRILELLQEERIELLRKR